MTQEEINKIAIKAFEKIVLYHGKMKIPSFKEFLACWEFPVGKHWYVAVNGHNRITSTGPKDGLKFRVPPYTACIWYDGLGVGWVNPKGGLINHKSLKKMPDFIKAMNKLIEGISEDA